jgi:hypothetical protein
MHAHGMSHRLQILLVVREASSHAYPTADPEAMEAEIARGYLERGA